MSTNGIIKRGLLAGAAGTTLLNGVTYLDMALRGRPASDSPEKIVDALLSTLGRQLPGGAAERDRRRTALGALSGIASGLGIGVAASALRAVGVRLPRPLATLATGAGAMGATSISMMLAGLTDPREWSASDWVSDAIPHLAYGIGAHAVIAREEPPPVEVAAHRASGGLLVRSSALGMATGIRSSLGLAGPAIFGRPTRGAAGTAWRALPVAGELIADKLPQTPSRLQPPALGARLAVGAGGSVTLARHSGVGTGALALPALLGVAGAAAGSYGGAAWRRWAAARMPDWRGALIEDGVGLGLAYVACRGR